MKDRNLFDSQRGFTLLELVTTITLMGVLGVTIVMPLLEVTRGQRRQEVRFELLDQGSIAVRRILNEVRDISRLGDTTPEMTVGEEETVGFGTTRYRLSGTTLERSQDSGSSWKTLANRVSGLAFSYYGIDGSSLSVPLSSTDLNNVRRIAIALDMGHEGEILNLRSSAYLQNFAFKDE